MTIKDMWHSMPRSHVDAAQPSSSVVKSQVRGGVRLTRVDEGPDDDGGPLLLLHGWACEGSSLEAQRRRFCRERRVIVPDLRGHGRSDAPRQDYDIATFVDDLAWQLDDLRIDRAAVVGHSMGGAIGLELAARYPTRVSGVLMIDSVLLPSTELGAGLTSLLSVIESAGLDAALAQASALLFEDDDDASTRSSILEKMKATPLHVAISSLRGHLFNQDTLGALLSCRAPIGYIMAAKSLANTARMDEIHPGIMFARTLGSGHFSPQMVPNQINAMIDRFIRLVDGDTG